MTDARTTVAYDASDALLAKLSLPKLRGPLVPRARLLHRLSEATSGPLTVVRGPAGSGKTTLVASWVAHDLPAGPVAWLTLDERDNHPVLFWTGVVEALRRHGVDLPAGIGPSLHSDGVDGSFLRRLGRGLGHASQTVVLVLDQLEAVTNVEILRGLDDVRTRAAPELRLVLSTRREPSGPFRRDVLRGGFDEIGPAELAFGYDEARQLLAQHDVELPDPTLEAVQRHVEGRAAGLLLCALAIQSGVDVTELVSRLPAPRLPRQRGRDGVATTVPITEAAVERELH
jgi:LuxR family maltose regulon positive regulatory protein